MTAAQYHDSGDDTLRLLMKNPRCEYLSDYRQQLLYPGVVYVAKSPVSKASLLVALDKPKGWGTRPQGKSWALRIVRHYNGVNAQSTYFATRLEAKREMRRLLVEIETRKGGAK